MEITHLDIVTPTGRPLLATQGLTVVRIPGKMFLTGRLEHAWSVALKTDCTETTMLYLATPIPRFNSVTIRYSIKTSDGFYDEDFAVVEKGWISIRPYKNRVGGFETRHISDFNFYLRHAKHPMYGVGGIDDLRSYHLL